MLKQNKNTKTSTVPLGEPQESRRKVAQVVLVLTEEEGHFSETRERKKERHWLKDTEGFL